MFFIFQMYYQHLFENLMIKQNLGSLTSWTGHFEDLIWI